MSNATWDVFHAERLEAERGLTALQVRQARARGDIQDDDLIRPAGSSQPWIALADCPEIDVEEPVERTQAPPTPPTPRPIVEKQAEPKTEGATGMVPGTSEEDATEFLAAPDEFNAPAVEKGDEPDDAGETRFFQGMLEDEFDVLNESDRPIAYPRGTSFGLGPSEDELDALSAGFPRPDGKVEDPLDFDPNLNLNAKRLGTPGHEQDLETWDDGEPGSLGKPSPIEDGDSELELIDDDAKQGANLLDLSVELEGPGEDENDQARDRYQDAEDDLDDDEAEEEDEYDPVEEDEAAAEFTLARGSTRTVEELDLAAMVDVAFQLVLFFLVTATTVLYKSLEVPKPNPESSPAASATQGKSLDELKNDFILVEIDPEGRLKIDQESVDPRPEILVRRLRSAREETGRQSMLLSADFTTPHRSAVLAYDAANEIGLGIAIARPTPKP